MVLNKLNRTQRRRKQIRGLKEFKRPIEMRVYENGFFVGSHVGMINIYERVDKTHSNAGFYCTSGGHQYHIPLRQITQIERKDYSGDTIGIIYMDTDYVEMLARLGKRSRGNN